MSLILLQIFTKKENGRGEREGAGGDNGQARGLLQRLETVNTRLHSQRRLLLDDSGLALSSLLLSCSYPLNRHDVVLSTLQSYVNCCCRQEIWCNLLSWIQNLDRATIARLSLAGRKGLPLQLGVHVLINVANHCKS